MPTKRGYDSVSGQMGRAEPPGDLGRQRRESETVVMAEGEARWLELLHVHNASVDKTPLLGLQKRSIQEGFRSGRAIWTGHFRYDYLFFFANENIRGHIIFGSHHHFAHS